MPALPEEAGAAKQASLPAWQGRNTHSAVISPFPHLSISVCSLLPLYILKAKMHTTVLAHHGAPLLLNSPCSMRQIPLSSHTPSPPGHIIQRLSEKTSTFGRTQRNGGCPHRPAFSVPRVGVSISSSLPSADVDSPNPSLLLLPNSEAYSLPAGYSPLTQGKKIARGHGTPRPPKVESEIYYC